jgi:hypothetical protein
VSQTKNTRRYYLLKVVHSRELDDDWDTAWRAKQRSFPGAELPDDFPFRERLAAKDYSTVEDLDGADASELSRSGFSARDSIEILAALPPLL